MIQVYQQIQSRPRSAMQTTGQHHPFQQDNCLIYNHVATVTIQLGIKKHYNWVSTKTKEIKG